MLRTSHPSGSRQDSSLDFKPLAPRRPSQSSVPNRVQQCLTESMAQLSLSSPDTVHGLGET